MSLRPVRKRKKGRTLGPVDIIRREDYAELEVDAKVELIRSLVPLGLMHVEELLDAEVTALAGERYARKDASVGGRRHGSNPGTVGLAGQRVPIRVPRLRRSRSTPRRGTLLQAIDTARLKLETEHSPGRRPLDGVRWRSCKSTLGFVRDVWRVPLYRVLLSHRCRTHLPIRMSVWHGQCSSYEPQRAGGWVARGRGDGPVGGVMESLRELLATDHRQALEFFVLGLLDVSEPAVDRQELLYNASVLAHFAQVSTRADSDVPAPTSLSAVFDHFVLDTTLVDDSAMMETAGA